MGATFAVHANAKEKDLEMQTFGSDWRFTGDIERLKRIISLTLTPPSACLTTLH